jgi:hypothetical protein
MSSNEVHTLTHLRTDLPLIPDQEMGDWVQDIVENTHYRDIQTLCERLDDAIQSEDNSTTGEIVYLKGRKLK